MNYELRVLNGKYNLNEKDSTKKSSSSVAVDQLAS